MKRPGVFILGLGLCGAAQAAYWGQSDSVTVAMTGCNAVSNYQLPGQTDLFIGRALFDPTGNPIAEKCTTPRSSEADAASRMGLVLNRMNWATHTLSIVKPLFAPQQGPLTAGPLNGYTVRTAFDPYVLLYNGAYLVAFQCNVNNSSYGPASCMAVYDPVAQTINAATIHVVVGETKSSSGDTSAAVPALIAFNGNAYLYWSAVTNVNGVFTRIGVRGAQLVADSAGLFWVLGANGAPAQSLDATSVEVWGPTAGDPLSDTAVDIKSVWVSGTSIVAIASLGGSGCAKSGPLKGCWRMGMAKAATPLGDHVFNTGPLLDAPLLPTNGQGYTHPIKFPGGSYGLLGIFFAPAVNGFSELRPAPPDWAGRGNTNYTTFTFQDSALWPSASSVTFPVPDAPVNLQVTTT